jgi:hypothetical protein
MAGKSMRDYIHSAFFARDKATLAQIVKDAEEEGNGDDDEKEHKEPDGDEGKQAIVIHNHHSAAPSSDDATISGRVKKLEDGFKSFDAKLTKVLDAISGDAAPPWLKKDGDGDDDDSDEGDNDKEKTEDEPPAVGNGEPDEQGALTAEQLTSAEPDLMQPDPSLKTGKSMMGDAAYNARVEKALGLLIKDVRARAEVLSPGFKMATVDSKLTKATVKALCGARRSALLKASATDAGKAALGRFNTTTIKSMSCDAVRVLFLDTSDRVKAGNNHSAAPRPFVTADEQRSFRENQAQRIRDLNKANKEFWDKQTGRDHRDTQRH